MTSNLPLHEQQTTPLNRERVEVDSKPDVLVPGEIRTLQAQDNEQALFRISDTPLAGNTEPDLFNLHTNNDGDWVLESTGIDPKEPGGQWKVPKDVEFTIGDKGIYMRLRGEQEPPRIIGDGKLPLVAQRLVAHALQERGNRAITLSAFESSSSEGQSLALRNTGAAPLALETHVVTPETGEDVDATQQIDAKLIKELDDTQQVDMTEVLEGGREEEKTSETTVEVAVGAQNTDMTSEAVHNEPELPAETISPEEPAQPAVETSELSKREAPGFRLEALDDLLGTQVRVREAAPEVDTSTNISDIASRLGVTLDGEHEATVEESERIPAIKLEGLTPVQVAERLKTYAVENLEAMATTITGKYEALVKTIAATGMKVQPVAQGIVDAMTETETVLKGQLHELQDVSKVTDAYAKVEQVSLELDAAMVAERQLAIEKAQQMSGLLGTMSEQTDDSAVALKKAHEYLTTMQRSSTSNSTNPEVFLEAQNKMLEELQKAREALTARGETRRKVTNMFED